MPAWAFEARANSTPDPDPITFTVAGREFRCVPMAPAAALDLLTDLPPIPAPGGQGFRTAVVAVASRMALAVRFCLEPDDYASWDELVSTTYLDPDFYLDCSTSLLVEYTHRLQRDAATDEPGLSQDELDPITARQIELDREAFDPGPPVPDLPPHLAAIRDAGGGFTLPT